MSRVQRPQDNLLTAAAEDVVVPGWLLDTNVSATAIAVLVFVRRGLGRADLAERVGVSTGTIDRCLRELRETGLDQPAKEDEETTALRETAAAVAREVWEKRTPRPMLKFVALTAMARRALSSGWTAEEVTEAMMMVPTFSDRSLEYSLADVRGRQATSNANVARRVARSEGLIP